MVMTIFEIGDQKLLIQSIWKIQMS